MIDNKNLERRTWTIQEDNALKTLYQQLKINKWSFIAQQLEQKHGFTGRTGKQCRQRYNNNLDPSLCRDQWSLQQQKKLYKLHDDLGNKWAVISNKLGPGRTDNNVKNHFFSRLRKSLRKINKIIKQKHKKQFRTIQTKVLYKIIQASQQKFKSQPMCQLQIIQYSKSSPYDILALKNKILMFSYDNSEIIPREIIQEIIQFNKNYKRKPKKFRKVGGPYPQLAQKIDYNQINDNINQTNSFKTINNSDSQSQSNEQDEIKKQSLNNSLRIETQKQKIISPIILTSNNKKMLPYKSKKSKVLQSNQDQRSSQDRRHGNNEQLLQQLGLLQDAADHPYTMFKRQKSVSYSVSQCPHQSQQFKFFDDSSMEHRFPYTNLSVFKRQSNDQKLFQ